MLADLDRRPPVDDVTPEALLAWRNLEFLRIAARDLSGRDQLEEVGAALAALGNQVLDSACALAAAADRDGSDDITLAVIGMGKLGGAELNYSSDIDVLFVGEGPRDPPRAPGPRRDGDRPALLPGRRQPPTRGPRRAARALARLLRGLLGPSGPSRGSSRRC